MKSIWTVYVVMVINASAFAADCIRIEYQKLDSTSQAKEPCQENKRLEIHAQSRSYPKLRDNPYTVEYWQGSYLKEIVRTDTYLREVYDVCHGKLLSSKNVAYTRRNFLEFAVENPNLSPEVDATYKLVPITHDEALVAMTAAYDLCSRFQPSTAPEVLFEDKE